jgi:hypothetical protein
MSCLAEVALELDPDAELDWPQSRQGARVGWEARRLPFRRPGPSP